MELNCWKQGWNGTNRENKTCHDLVRISGSCLPIDYPDLSLMIYPLRTTCGFKPCVSQACCRWTGVKTETQISSHLQQRRACSTDNPPTSLLYMLERARSKSHKWGFFSWFYFFQNNLFFFSQHASPPSVGVSWRRQHPPPRSRDSKQSRHERKVQLLRINWTSPPINVALSPSQRALCLCFLGEKVQLGDGVCVRHGLICLIPPRSEFESLKWYSALEKARKRLLLTGLYFCLNPTRQIERFPKLLHVLHMSIWERARRKCLERGGATLGDLKYAFCHHFHLRFLHCQWSRLVTA